MENKKKVKVISFVSAMMLFVIVVAAAFAYFSNMSAGLANNVAVNVTALEGGDSVFSSNATQLSMNIPASSMDSSYANNETAIAENTATLSVNLISGDDNQLVKCTYDIVYEYDYNSNVYGDGTTYVTKDGDTGEAVTKEITMQVSGPSIGTNNYNEEKNFNYDSSWTAKDTSNLVGAKRVLVSNAIIGNMSSTEQTTQNWIFTGKYYNLDIFQTQLSNQAFTGKIYVSNKNCEIGTNNIGTAGNTLLAKNGGINSIITKGTPVFTNSATSNEGMYVTEDDYGISYYFRGAVDNNWLKFGEVGGKSIYWRIIRINGDGSIRLLYTGTTAPTSSQKVVMTGTGTKISESTFNSGYNSPEYVGYKYEIGKQHGLANDSTIKTTLENWYKTTTLYTDEATSKLVVDTPFCYDRTASTSETGTYGEIDDWVSTGTTYNYGSYGRNANNGNKTGPSLKCPNELDKYSVSNGTIENPVGLITADEIVLAGGNSNNNSSYYLYTGQKYWSGSPDYFTSYSIGYSYVFIVSSSGDLHYNLVYDMDDTSGIRPSVSLSSEAKLSGDGTWNNPYTVDLS